jgi:hypothetical protein
MDGITASVAHTEATRGYLQVTSKVRERQVKRLVQLGLVRLGLKDNFSLLVPYLKFLVADLVHDLATLETS